MGNRLTTGLNCCKQASGHQQIEMDSIKTAHIFPKIEIIPRHDAQASDNQTQIQQSKSMPQQCQSTATTTFSPQISNNLNATTQEITLKMSNMNVTEAAQDVIKVPFSIIKLSLSNKLMKILNHHCDQILGRLQEDANRWILTKKGHYVSVINDTFVSLFSENAFYEGQIKRGLLGNFIPSKDGLLATEEGIYKGSFEEGRAHGKGIFVHGLSKTSFKGEWSNGTFISGTIQNSSFKFNGQMKDGFAEGKGRLIFKKDGSEYKGFFKEGKYDGDDCMLTCPQYTYKGCFKDGYKNGKGTVEEKEQKIDLKIGSTRIKKYRPPAQFFGEWRNDSLITIINQT